MIKVGLIKGRHDIPVSGYIFDHIEDIFDYGEMSQVIREFIRDNVGVRICGGLPVNSAGEDCYIFKGEQDLCVYVTGLTAVTAQLISECAYNGVKLTLMHYNSVTGEYVPQHIF